MSEDQAAARCYDKPVWTLSDLLAELPRVPGQLRSVAPTLTGGLLSNALRERLMLTVAAENRCRYCQLAHAAFGQAAGLTPDEVAAILSDHEQAGRPEGERLAQAYVQDLARRGFASRDDSLRSRLGDHYDERTVEAIEATARLMNLANRFGNTFDAALARLRGRCDSSSAGLGDLALLSPLFVAGAAVVAPAYLSAELLARLRRSKRPAR